MIETHAFLVMFGVQILAGSILAPWLFIRRLRPTLPRLPAERFSELFPGVNRDQSAARFATVYRALNAGIAVLGAGLLIWLSIHKRSVDWTDDMVEYLLAVYLVAQMSPLAFMGWKGARSMKALKGSLAEGKRKAVLQRRRLFDFVSPNLVFVAILSYLLVAALVLYTRQHPFPGFDGLTNVVSVTLVWALYGILVYGSMYGRSRFPMATHSARLYSIGMLVKTLVYSGIGVTAFTSLELTLGLLHLQRWDLFSVSAFFVLGIALTTLSPRRPPTAFSKHTEISLPVAEIDQCVGRYDLGRGFRIAIARDGGSLWWLRLDVPGAQPVPIFPEAPLLFFWKDIDQQIRFTTNAGGVVTGAEVTNGGSVVTGQRVEPGVSPTFSRPIEYGPA